MPHAFARPIYKVVVNGDWRRNWPFFTAFAARFVQKLKRVYLAGVFIDVRIDQRLGLWSNFLR